MSKSASSFAAEIEMNRRGTAAPGASGLGDCGCGVAAGLDVADRGLAEEAAVLAAELAGAFVADFEGGAGRVETLVEHALAATCRRSCF